MTSTTTATVVGSYTIDKAYKHRYDISETASRYEEVLLDAGTYPVFAIHDHLYAYDARLYVLVPGTVTSRYDGAEFCGVAIGSSPQHDRHPDVGKSREVRLAVFADVEFNETGVDVLAKHWLTRLSARGGGGLELVPHYSLMWRELVPGVQRYTLEMPGAMVEFFDESHALMLRVNELMDAGVVPAVFRIYSSGHRSPCREHLTLAPR